MEYVSQDTRIGELVRRRRSHAVAGPELQQVRVQRRGRDIDCIDPTGAYAGVSGNSVMGAGYNINKSNAIIGEFMYSGLPSNLYVLRPVKAPTSSISLYSLTVNCRHQFDRISGSPFGVYFMGGGGWYQRYITLDKNYTLPAAVPCLRYWNWYGYSCAGGYVYSDMVAKRA